MIKTDVAIIGGSAGGLMAAITLKKRNPEKKVTVIRNVVKTPVPCGIPYIYGLLKDVEKDIIPDKSFLDMGIEILPRHVDQINRSGKELIFENGEKIGYEKLIIATGSKPFIPPLPGVDLENVFTITKDPVQLQKLYDALQKARNVVVIGGGFIGVEMAEQIALMGKSECSDYFCTPEEHANSSWVTLIEMMPHCLLAACEEEFCIEAEGELRNLGIEVKTSTRVEALKGEGKVTGITLAGGQTIPADLVIIAIGVAPNIELAAAAGLKADTRGGVVVDEYLRTEDPAIFAVGDCASKFSFVTGKPSPIRLASVASCEGMIAASNLDAPVRKTIGALGAFATAVGKRCIAAAGMTSAAAAQEGIEVIVGTATGPNRHPGALPGCIMDMKAKLLFRKEDGKIIGGHIRGGEAAADMVNVIAAAIQAGQTAENLATMQYATHPLLTASPLAYHIMLAAENAAAQL